jgi:hypothetical protein
MPLRKLLAVTAIILCSALASAKKKAILPADVLRARTVLVIVDPTAGAARFLAPANFFDHLNSFCQSNSHGNNTSQVLYFCSVLPSAAGSGRQRVRNQR